MNSPEAKEKKPREEESIYNDVQGDKEYEDPEYFYGAIGNPQPSSTTQIRIVPPPPPPPILKPTHIAIHNHKKKATPKWKAIFVGIVASLATLALIASIVALLIIGAKAKALERHTFTQSEPVFPIVQPEFSAYRRDGDVTANHLLTLIITKRKLCIFEAGGGDDGVSRKAFERDHVEGARLLFHSNLSHSGVPVHPLQFQRYARSLGVDNDCHVVIYDRGQVIWSTYAYWVFKLFGHQRVSLLAGGYLAWKTQQGRSQQYQTEAGQPEKAVPGDFLASWNQAIIITFDDVLLNSQQKTHDIVDAQTKEEFQGIALGALYGHIEGAVNIPVDSVYDWGTGEWLSTTDQAEVFHNAGLNPSRSVIVYCSTSLRASMIWWALTRTGYSAKLYFGGWPEWVVRSPDELKHINA